MTPRNWAVAHSLIESAPLLVTVAFTAYVVLTKRGEDLQQLVVWVLSVVGLLATSELIQRAFLLRRIEAASTATLEQVQKLSTPLTTTVYASRIDAMGDIRSLVAAENVGLSIVAGSLGGTSRLIPDLALAVSRASSAGVKIRVFLCHPEWMAHRAEQEGASPSAQRRRTVERLHELLEVSDIPLQCIRLYRAIPTCSVIVAHGQRRLFLNPYTLGEIAENTLSLMLDGAAHPGAYDGFVYAHIDRPWCSNALSGSLETFVAEQKTAVARQIARRIYEEYLRKRAKTPIVAAINGCTAAGKTGLATEVSACLSDEIAPRLSRVVLDTDGWISVSRAERISRHLTCCEPEAYDLPALQYALDRLAEGRDASNRAYDHRAGTPGQAGAIGSADVIIVDGLMSTHRTLNRTPDVSVWVQLSPDTHKRVRIERDVRERGYTPEEAAENWELHERAWPKFERLARPPDCILVRGDRARMLFVDD